jgi:hypothetical protein
VTVRQTDSYHPAIRTRLVTRGPFNTGQAPRPPGFRGVGPFRAKNQTCFKSRILASEKISYFSNIPRYFSGFYFYFCVGWEMLKENPFLLNPPWAHQSARPQPPPRGLCVRCSPTWQPPPFTSAPRVSSRFLPNPSAHRACPCACALPLDSQASPRPDSRCRASLFAAACFLSVRAPSGAVPPRIARHLAVPLAAVAAEFRLPHSDKKQEDKATARLHSLPGRPALPHPLDAFVARHNVA